MRLIAIVGMAGSGKSELSKLFGKKGFRSIRFGDITDKFLKDRGLALSEENEKKVREGLRKEHGMEAYAKLNVPRIDEAIKEGDVIIDGLYSWEEYQFLKEKYGKRIIILALYAPPEMRYERLNEREIRPLTREQAQSRDIREIENLNKAAPIAMADYTMLNVGTLFDLGENLDKFLLWLEEEYEK